MSAQTAVLPDFTVTATRLEQPLSQVPRHAVVLPLVDAAPLPLDYNLRSIPSFSLFRRNTSSVLQPTSQGVSLRGIGPSGASRTAVFLDRIPVTDAFGAWVAWPKLSPLELAAVELLPGGGSGSWGNAALSGTMHLVSREWQPGQLLSYISAGSRGSVEGELAGALDASGTLSFSAGVARRHSPPPIAPELAGAVDRDASLEFSRLTLGWSRTLAGGHVVKTQLRSYADERGNGTAGQYNAYRERQASLALVAPRSAPVPWSALAYAQRQHFRSTFTAVGAGRTSETPSSDQYAVPATTWGAALQALWKLERTRLAVGADLRGVKGETREAYSFNGSTFTRDRRAGGQQEFYGAFAQGALTPADTLTISGGTRVDYWRQTAGHRRDTSTDGSIVYRDEQYKDRTGIELTPEAGVSWKPAKRSRVFLSGQSGFRRPTLNELYRPFRVGNDLTEPNANLGTERIFSAETGGELTTGPFAWRATLFRHELHDVVATVTRYRGPGTYPDYGFIPAGGTGRTRANLDRALTQGAEFGVQVDLPRGAKATLAWQTGNSTVERASAAPELVGKRIPQVPQNIVTGQLTVPIGARVTTSLFARWSDAQYEDDDNRLILPAAATVDAALQWRIDAHWLLFFTMQNLFDEEVEASRSATGSHTLGHPQEWRAGVSWQK
ncbi:MAG: TonB-dependent receptor [Opitutaceae bacterium]|nr:TonB-dependent receptor [Opitutaceae bacterium]